MKEEDKPKPCPVCKRWDKLRVSGQYTINEEIDCGIECKCGYHVTNVIPKGKYWEDPHGYDWLSWLKWNKDGENS